MCAEPEAAASRTFPAEDFLAALLLPELGPWGRIVGITVRSGSFPFPKKVEAQD
jgi:hypothetical protein